MLNYVHMQLFQIEIIIPLFPFNVIVTHISVLIAFSVLEHNYFKLDSLNFNRVFLSLAD